MVNLSSDVTRNIPEFVKTFHLDPKKDAVTHLAMPIPHSLGCFETCTGIGFSSCSEFNMNVNHVDVAGAATAKWVHTEMVKCDKIYRGGKCKTCNNSPGDSDFGMDMQVKVSTLP